MKKRILVIDRDPTFLKMMVTFLEKFGFLVEAFFDSQALLNSFVSDEVRLVITNFGKNGEGEILIREIKKISPEVRIICLTGDWHPRSEVICKKAGCDSFLQKPIELEQLRLEIKRLLK